MNKIELQNETATHNGQQLNSNNYLLFYELEKIEKHLKSIAYSLDYMAFDNKRTVDKSHSIPD